MNFKRLDQIIFIFSCISFLHYTESRVRNRNSHNNNHHLRARRRIRNLGWGFWSQWSPCNAECETGVSTRTRDCLQVTCRGHGVEHKVCNRQECRPYQLSLRESQCSSHNGKKFGGRHYRWLPYTIGKHGCQLTCRAETYGFYNTFSDPVLNGTLCSEDGSAVCVNGHCLTIGCDDIVGSKASRDICGVCDGDGTSCRVIKETFNTRNPDYGYSKIGSIPTGARNINITQLGKSRNYLALREVRGVYFINGNRRLSRDGKHKAVGSKFRYHRRRTSQCPGECILSKGPTTAPIDIMILSFGHNPGIVYQYSLPQDDGPENSRYQAIIVEDDFGKRFPRQNSSYINRNESLKAGSEFMNETEYKNMSQSKGIGRRRERPSGPSKMPGYTQSFGFLDKMKERKRTDLTGSLSAGETFSKIQSDKQRQTIRIDSSIASNIIPGTEGFRWAVTGFTPCSATCGNGTRRPYLECFYGNTRVDERKCRYDEKTAYGSEPCALKPCPAWSNNKWQPSDWSPCSVTCGTGIQTRKLSCVQEISTNVYVSVIDHDCLGLTRPNTTQICQINACNNWQADAWSQCSASCGVGMRSRRVTCISMDGRRVQNNFCDIVDKPPGESSCSNGPCSNIQTRTIYVSMNSWYTSEWSQSCSASCGEGKLTRKVVCLSETNNGCKENNKPQSERRCKSREKCVGLWFTGPWQQCNVTCGQGHQNRDVLCMSKDMRRGFSAIPDYRCDIRLKPEVSRTCQERQCDPEWFMSEWGQCSVTCGRGRKSRDVQCLDAVGRPSRRCNQRNRPTSVKECKEKSCKRNKLVSDSLCQDRYSKCDIIVNKKLCSRKFYQRMCCNSCSTRRI